MPGRLAFVGSFLAAHVDGWSLTRPDDLPVYGNGVLMPESRPNSQLPPGRGRLVIFNGLRSRKFEAVAKIACRKLAILHSASVDA